MNIGDFIRWEKLDGEPVTVRDVRVTPQARALSVRLPFGGLVWNRPVSLLVERGEIREQITIPDVTLVTGIAFALVVIFFSMVVGQRRRGSA